MTFLPTSELLVGMGATVAEDAYAAGQPPEELETGAAARHVDEHLQTPYTDTVLQRRLFATSHAARVHLEERGVNVLYLALGMLHWYEAKESQEVRRAPLVLVPVELQRRSVSSRFKVVHNGTPIGENLCLRLKLKQEFGVDLPSLTEDDETDISAYLRQVAEAVSGMGRWSVEGDEINLGFFSFMKLLMFEDLDPERWPEGKKPHEHGLIRQLLEDGFGDDPLELDDDGHLDQHLDPESLFHVVDADSSQAVAIHNVMRGRNMVIQGPPGTGKSQTITNLIAEAVAAGKKVLFVAEKMAALDVVKRRLDHVGLGDACLELHSHTSNKRALLQELSRTHDLGKPHDGRRAEIADGLREAGERLNAYAAAVNQPLSATGITPYEAYGNLLRAQQRLVPLDPPRVERAGQGLELLRPADVRTREATVRELQGLLGQMGIPEEHPFWGSETEVFVPTLDAPEIVQSTRGALEQESQCQSAIRELATALGLPGPASLAGADQVLLCAQRLMQAPDLGGVSVASPSWSRDARQLDHAIASGVHLAGTKRDLDDRLLPHAWSADLAAVRASIAHYGPKWWRALSSEYRAAKRRSAGLWRGQLPRGLADELKAIDAILLVQQLRGEIGRLRTLLSDLFGREIGDAEEDWPALRAILDYLQLVHREVSERLLPDATVELLQVVDRRHLGPLVAAAEQAMASYRSALKRAMAAAKVASVAARAIEGATFEAQRHRIEAWHREPGRLQEMAAYRRLVAQVESEGMGLLVSSARSWVGAAEGLLELFRAARFASLLELAQRERLVLASFDGARHRAVLADFCGSDRLLLERNRAAVALRHWEGMPEMSGVGQVGVLAHEMQKKRRHRPIRQLMTDAGRAVQAIKPVFMMSPLSIAAFLPPGSVEFDLVVFDEASQVRPVDAYGALLRGGQVVVVGDSKQLPPSSFFDKMDEEAPEEDRRREGVGPRECPRARGREGGSPVHAAGGTTAVAISL